ncbi:hypothetical protein THASP1DRAFT_32131 [Thamnocephalis sphaerospora]|uniref:Uncharacterized protein n=1 Tax=Thamnocephalis sphaerospora TaxID=78915 RepID=A0A4P9XJS8_9FUNG|nr:hypothetical protein THASP1DRAFT_32131 [Thamnocephalis sphaerospora]|eukprot:RKP06038.1 hypothetical protein THASP1DRAFT_32131 [Thamnocephalis sphaerospora]
MADNPLLNATWIVTDVDLSKFQGIDPSGLQPSPFSKVIGDWEAISLSSRSEYHRIVMAMLPVLLLLLRFIYNTYMAGVMLYNRRESVFWLNFIQAAIGVVAAICALLRGLAPWAIACRDVAHSSEADMYIGTTAIVGILFAKAYYSTNRSRIVFCIGALAVTLTFAVGLASVWAMVTFEYGSGRCAMALDYRWIIAKFAVDILSNISLSGCFLYVMWMQSQKLKRHIFWMLFQDGLIYFFGTIVSNVIATTMVLTMHSLTFWHSHIYAFDYCIVSTLICWQMWQAKKRQARKTRTEPIRMGDLGITDNRMPQGSVTLASANDGYYNSNGLSTLNTVISIGAGTDSRIGEEQHQKQKLMENDSVEIHASSPQGDGPPANWWWGRRASDANNNPLPRNSTNGTPTHNS